VIRRVSATKAIATACLLACAQIASAAVDVGAASKVDFADAVVSLGCGDLVVAGQTTATAAQVDAIASLAIAAGATLAPGASRFSVGGNFVDAGTFAPGTSRIAIVDTCGGGTSAISGSTDFYDFAATSASGKQLVLPAALTQNVAHALTLQGAAGSLLLVESSAAGQQAVLAVGAGAAQTIAYVDARDNKAGAAPIAPGAASLYNSVNAGGLTHWFDITVPAITPVPAPSLNAWGLLLLGIAAIVAASRHLRA
jgi:hypothetical protein